jgi:hypothetical protein
MRLPKNGLTHRMTHWRPRSSDGLEARRFVGSLAVSALSLCLFGCMPKTNQVPWYNPELVWFSPADSADDVQVSCLAYTHGERLVVRVFTYNRGDSDIYLIPREYRHIDYSERLSDHAEDRIFGPNYETAFEHRPDASRLVPLKARSVDITSVSWCYTGMDGTACDLARVFPGTFRTRCFQPYWSRNPAEVNSWESLQIAESLPMPFSPMNPSRLPDPQ